MQPSKVFLGVFLSFLILLTVSGNVLVCLAVCASRRLRCLTNCFIVSLAVTDLLLGLLVLPFSALIQLSGDWPLGPTFCNLYTSLDVMLCTASILTLLAISVDRYLAVTAPLRYGALVLPGRVAVAMAAVWAVALAVSFLPIHMGWNTLDGHVQNRGPRDAERACHFELNAWYALVDSSLTFYLPLVAMCWTYSRILCIARAQARRVLGARRRGAASVTAVAFREHKATVTLAAVIGAFVVCWLPYFTLFTVMGWREQAAPAPVAYPVVLWLGYTNSALNPILYAALNRDFRSAYGQLLRCRWYGRGRGRPVSPNLTAGAPVVAEGTLLCGHTPGTCRAGLVETSIMLQDMNGGGAKATIQLSNGAAEATQNERLGNRLGVSRGGQAWVTPV
ncbi:histamine receptor H2a [Aplochiton taeniatus]